MPPPKQPQIVNAVLDYWDGTSDTFNNVEVHVPTPGLYRFVTAGAGTYPEIAWTSIKKMFCTPQ